jgi:type VI secretion system secreted protein Hcp
MKKKILFAVTAIFFTGLLLQAQTIILSAEGTKQGIFKGESTRPKFEGKSEIAGYVQEVNSPRDPASGLASGKRNHQPIIILKKSGTASPQFFQALATNETLKKVIIDFYKPDPSGVEKLYYTITLDNATVSGYKQFIGPLDNEKFNPDNMTLYDEIKLTFQKITVEEKIGKTMATDDWGSIGRF